MDCSQILPGAVNPGPCSVATGYLYDVPFICYASGKNLVFLDGKLQHIQTLLGANCGYTDTRITCVHVADFTAKVAAAWGSDVVIFKPESMETDSHGKTVWTWKPCHTATFQFKVLSLNWNREGTQLLVGGDSIVLWECWIPARTLAQARDSSPNYERGGAEVWKEVWSMKMASPVVHIRFSADGALFASASTNDRLVKIWYTERSKVKYKSGGDSRRQYSFTYVSHPRAVTGVVWRKLSHHMPKEIVPNVLLTRCSDNICRLWSHTVPKEKAPMPGKRRFFIAASIDPVADIPFRSTMPMEDASFIVHWLNNKEMAFTGKASKIIVQNRLTRNSSMASLVSGVSGNEEMLASWVCVEEKSPDAFPGKALEKVDPSSYHSYALGDYLTPGTPHRSQSPPGMPPCDVGNTLSKKQLTQLMEEWVNSPDLMVCIHPNTGSLMVWTVEGLDAFKFSSRLVHLSFSSCLPHVLPPHLAQTLQHELQQYLLREMETKPAQPPPPGNLHSHLNVSDVSLPVPQIKLPTGKNVFDIPESTRTLRPDSSLILLSSHHNGSLNAWSVELTVQTCHCTSIAGLIHCGQTGGHCSEVVDVHRHPWLPVIMTVATVTTHSDLERENELIIWNADFAGPLDQLSQVKELSRLSSSKNGSFSVSAWLPPISVTSKDNGALSRCPSFGLFVTNVGSELCLFQTSLYPIIPPNSSSGVYHTTQPLHERSSTQVTITSHSGFNGIAFIKLLDEEINDCNQIVSLHTFRMSSAVLEKYLSKSFNDHDVSEAVSPDEVADLSDEVLIVMIKNMQSEDSSVECTSSPLASSSSQRSYLYVWRVVLCDRVALSPQRGSLDSWYQPQAIPTQLCNAEVTKIFAGPFPLKNHNSYISQSHPSCDIASSLQLQLPSLSSPYLFSTIESDGNVSFWQFKVKLSPNSLVKTNLPHQKWLVTVVPYDVFADDLVPNRKVVGLLNCTSHPVLKELPLASSLPSTFASAYPGRFAMAHLLSKPIKPIQTGTNPLGKHAMVSVWECESSGGQQWVCESVLSLHSLGVSLYNPKASTEQVLMDWLPMENGAYLLATCFSSVISIFGMAMPINEEQLSAKPTRGMQRRFSKSVSIPVLSSMKAFSSWVCLLHFPCCKSYAGLATKWLCYTGSNSIMIGVGCEMHVYSCWVNREQLEASRGVSKSHLPQAMASKHSRLDPRLYRSDWINLLDYAHSKNTPLPQYHPKILTDLLYAGKLDAVKLILLNLVKYLLLYQEGAGGCFSDNEVDGTANQEGGTEKSRLRLLSFGAEEVLKRSSKAPVTIQVEDIPPVSLSQLKIFSSEDVEKGKGLEEDATDSKQTEADDNYDELFTNGPSTSLNAELLLGDELDNNVSFDSISLEKADFPPHLADRLSSILHYARLPDINDLEQFRLLAIAHTVARTKTSFGDLPTYSSLEAQGTWDLGTSTGAGYAASGFVRGGIGGGEAMDDCGLRYLLALQNYLTLSASLPKAVEMEGLAPRHFVWAFHSDAEIELLSNIPCVQEDRLQWNQLRDAGVGWWVRSNDTLRKLAEKLAKNQFMTNQDPLEASLFYLAMKKRSVLKGLFKTVGDQRMMQFFSNDFKKDRWHRAALKNAFSLLSKQRFEQAAAFFLLGNQLWDAVEVCINRLHDLQLAFVIIRLYEGDGSPSYFRLLKEHVLGITTTGHEFVEPSPDPFLRSISLWLLQDYLCALETLLVDLKAGSNRPLPPNPAIFDFYFYLRSHPLLLRTKYPMKQGRSVQPSPSVANFSTQYHPHHLSGVGDDSLTVVERNLVFSTAYHQLNSGSPLLALTVLSRIPKTEDLGAVSEFVSSGSRSTTQGSQRSTSASAIMSGMLSEESISFSIGDTDLAFASGRNLGSIKEEEEDMDWSKPVTSQLADATESVNFTLQRPASAHVFGVGRKDEHHDTNDDFDWSKPVTAQDDDFDWSTPISMQKLDNGVLQSQSPRLEDGEEMVNDSNKDEQLRSSTKLFSCRGMFVLSLADQLQYNALLSLLTEELTTIHLPACCKLLWDSRGSESLPILPLKQYDATSSGSQSTLAEWFEDEAFEGILKSLQARIITWLQSETLIVKEVCGLEISAGHHVGVAAAHAGYDLLTTLMNYTTIHASTLPSMLAIKMELMHLMNTLVPWSTGLSSILEDADASTTTNHVSCAIFPAQLPLLTSSSLPSKHPLNLALHLRLMSSSVFELLSVHCRPPTASSPLEHTDRVFELCCALSHCVFLCLSPMRLHASNMPSAAAGANTTRTSSTAATTAQRKRTTSFDMLEFFSSLEIPDTKPSKWPGLENWPNSLLSDDGKDALPLCLVLMECLVVAYIGLLSVAWTKHSIYDLLILTANAPTAHNWTALFGGGKSTKSAKKSPSFLRNMRNVFSAMGKKREGLDSGTPTGLFIAPKISLLSHSLNKPGQDSITSLTHPVNFEKEPDDQSYDGDSDSGREEWMHDEVDGSTSAEEENHDNPDCYSWCLMNLGITKLVHKVLRHTIALTGMEVLEFITASPVLYKLLRLIEDWETFFSKQVENHASAPSMLLPSQRDEKEVGPHFGPALMRDKSILEADNSPFSDRTKSSRLAQRLWEYLVHQESLTETFIKYIFYNKRIGAVVEDEIQVHRILYREADSPVASLCINSGNTSVFALATSREVQEIEVPDILSLECAPYGEEGTETPNKRKSWAAPRSSPEPGDDFVMIAPGPHSIGAMSMGSHSHSLKRNSLAIPHMPAIGQHSQTGSTAALLLKRNLPGVKRMASHPNLAYYLTGSADGSVRMLEFGTTKPVSVLRQAGSAPSVTRIRFTPQGNKYGVTDLSGKLCLWQGIHTNTRSPYQTLNPLNTRRTISDFAFLGSSSLIATCGESPNSKNVCIWDTLMPPRSSIVKEFMCHEGGALAIAYSRNKQRLISGGKKGELSITDVRQKTIISKLIAHSSAVTCIVLNDTDGYFLTGSSEGDIKVWDLFTVTELTSIAGKHTRSRLFRSEGGVTDMVVDMDNMLYSCGYDGTVRVHTLNLPNS